MSDLMVAIGLVLVIEGLLYAMFPGFAKRLMARAHEMPETSLRAGGVGALGIGVILVWLVRG